MWSQVLPKINEAHIHLQTAGLNINQSELRLASLKVWLERQRENIIEEAIKFSKSLSEQLGIEQPAHRTRNEHHEVMSFEEQLCSEMRESIDRIIDGMGKRFDQLHRLVLRFGVLIPSNFFDENYSIRIDEHSVDIEISDFVKERLRLQSFVHVVDEEIKTSLIEGGPLELLEFILKRSLQATVPNVVILFRIFLTVGVSVSSCEWSFSKLKLIKNYLRSTMTSFRLSDLSILSIEHEETDRIDFDSVIPDFAEKKARKICLKYNYSCIISILLYSHCVINANAPQSIFFRGRRRAIFRPRTGHHQDTLRPWS